MRPLLILLLVPLLVGCGSGTTRPAETGPSSTDRALRGVVTVLAASSLTETFAEIARRFEAAHPEVDVRLSLGASSTLAQQITAGAPADVFAAAAPAPMRQVELAGEPTIFARNRLQIAVPPGNPGKVHRLAAFARPGLELVVCARQVPCGAAAARVFELADVEPVPDTYANNVKKVLTRVRLDEVDAGLVYRTDVLAAEGDVEGIDFPAAAGALNDYPISALPQAPNPRVARAFVAYVVSAKGWKILGDAGFERP